jgi:hypothetical protein
LYASRLPWWYASRRSKSSVTERSYEPELTDATHHLKNRHRLYSFGPKLDLEA